MNRRPPLSQWALMFVLIGSVSQPASASPPTRPGQPFGSVSGSTVSLNWLASSDDQGVAGYNVYRNNRYITTVSNTKYSGTINTAEANTFYVVAFDAKNSNPGRQYSDRSPTQTFSALSSPSRTTNTGTSTSTSTNTTNSTFINSTPTAPTALLTVRNTPNQVTLSWSASNDDKGVVGYNVYRNDRYKTTVRSTTFIDSTISSGSEYTYYVVAFDEPRNFSTKSVSVNTANGDTGNGDRTPPVVPPTQTINTSTNTSTSTYTNSGPDTQRPSIVQGVQASTGNGGAVNVRWNQGIDNVGVVGYNLYRNGGYLTTVFTNSHVDQSAPSEEQNRYAVVAFDKVRNYSVTSDYVLTDLGTTTTTPEPPSVPPPAVQPPIVSSNSGTPPTLREPNAAPIASPPASDPFGSLLEIDNELAVIGGPPTQPKNLRAELVSNDWAELNWAPSNDDGEVVEYRVYRSDGVVYTIREDQRLSNAANQLEIDRFWDSTLFIDCNYTRFNQQVHNCKQNQPNPGDEYTYQVSAVDDDGQESARSKPLEIIYHVSQNAPIPFYNDFYKPHDDKFAQEHDLSQVNYFIDEFSLVFADEFNGSEINADYWNTELVWGDNTIINGEQQFFVNSLAQPNFGFDPFNLTGDTLKIESIVTPENLIDSLPSSCNELDPFGKERCAFLSGALSSHDKFGITYGYVESRMKVSDAAGSLSSFYLYNRYPGTGKNLHSPEIDIIEYLGENPFGDELAFQTYHYANVNDGSTNSAPTMSYANPDGSKFDEDFHTFGVLWEPQLIIWYIDGQEVKRMTGPQVSRQRMNIVTYLVSGSSWAPTPDVNADIYPLEFELDYIRAYQRGPFDTNGLYPK